MTDFNKTNRPTKAARGPQRPASAGKKGTDEVTTEKMTVFVGGSGGGGGGPRVPLSEAKSISEAAENVVNTLEIEKFITEQWEKIDKKLRECDEYAKVAAPFGGDMIFISMAIPLANGVIHVGSTREKLEETTKYIQQEWQKASLAHDPERIPVISALTLIYLITKGWLKADKDLADFEQANADAVGALKKQDAQSQKASQQSAGKGSKGAAKGKAKKQGSEATPPRGDEEAEKVKDQWVELRDLKCRWERMRERVQRLCSQQSA